MTTTRELVIDLVSKLLSNHLQTEVIGVCRPKSMHDRTFWYMVIDVTDNQITAIRIGQFLGLTTLYIDKDQTIFHSFPEEKTLAETMDDLHNFNEWCMSLSK